MSDQPVLTSNESNIDIIVFGDTEEREESTNAKVDRDLPISIISRAMVERLGAEPKPSQQGPVKDSKGKLYTPIGKVDLLWHRKTASRTNPQTFFVVDLSGIVVIFGANAIPPPPDSSSNIHTLGLNTQTDDEKKRQENKKQIELAKRAKEKKDQDNREKEKQGQKSSSSSK